MKRNNRNVTEKRRLYNQAFQLWATIFNLEPSAQSCAEAWRLRHLAERAFARSSRRLEQYQKAKQGK